MSQESQQYWAFISYAHKDGASAKRLHGQLESYRVPRKFVARKVGSYIVRRRRNPVFYDEHSQADPDLRKLLETELGQSEFLIVICSPRAVKSEWVDKEVEYFRSLGRAILCLVIDGHPPECFPRSLRSRPPLAANVPRDGERKAKLRLVAGLLKVPYETLIWHDLLRRTLLGILALAATFLAVFLPLGGYRSYYYRLRDVCPNLCPIHLTPGTSNASIRTHLGQKSPLDDTLPVAEFAPETDRTVLLSARVSGARYDDRLTSLYYDSELRRGQHSWTALYLWTPAVIHAWASRLSASANGHSHFLLTLRSSARERLRVGFKDVHETEKKVTIDLDSGWRVYVIPLAAFQDVDMDALTLVCVAHEDDYAIGQHMELEILDMRFGDIANGEIEQ